MKKILWAIGVVILIGAIWASAVYWYHLRGVGPAIKPAPYNIVDVIEEAENNTDLPLVLPDGFSISVFAQGFTKPRVLTFDPVGNLVVSDTTTGTVYAMPDKNGDGVADENIPIVTRLNRPHGLAWRCIDECELYIAESDQLAIYDYDKANLKAANKRKLVDLPSGGNHYTRTLLFRPSPNENELLISIGSSCNVCNEEDSRRAKTLSYNVETKELKDFGTGLRNAVFMQIHPVTGEIWVTEMGRDLLGDDIPPDEINIVREGNNYGWPTCYGKNIHDISFDKNTYIRAPCDDLFETPSHIDIQAHSAPLGLAFIPEEGWPESWWYDLIVAYHGSWNRTEPTGYKLVRFPLDASGKQTGEVEDLISGWLTAKGALGRPVDVLILPGGVMYISDDKAGVIYKVTYNNPPL
ncbi:MAG: sorbosone dehydrogenase [Candidatus Buchananbacteria bacterium CG10_big_fil_rev_8_21_14_0_10_42_9]|uniref:Sorbosone dehydrogenase n=1 Tax=Candidatus Buchananbacteria bacterium CG10_big_fil_rev_8_21_14_0_10_42_9 TaxID=1974526 RepID=A0A2H0W2E5_9BACT|nr:MAG: sorbosone dehydrogenase [Candidatus Buchananbacteria bacterium CG10_big_fil_rev_8_21_14_0_10_42_9]